MLLNSVGLGLEVRQLLKPCQFKLLHMEPTTPNSLRSRHPHDDRARKFEVICKVRPLQPGEPQQDISISENAPTVTIYHPEKKLSKEFTFHRICGDNIPQGEFSETLVDEIMGTCRQNGKGCLVLSYGVTNSGKTFTIFGNGQNPGLLPVLIASLPQGQVRIRAVEIYNDCIYCLRTGKEVQWSDARCIQQCQFQPIDRSNSKEILRQFTKMRRTDETDSNATSSRSHAIFMVEWEGYHVAITDLAGNERFGAYTNFNETVKINCNLLVLGRCLTAFRDGEYIPYRRAKLTQVLVEYFKPSYKIFMVAHLNRTGTMFHENFNVMEYASLSTEIHHMEPNMSKNPSIAKSIRKDRSPSPVPFSKRPPPPALVSIKKQLQDDYERKQTRMLLQNYKCYIMGVHAQAEADLEQYFKKEDQKDRLFLEELKATKFISPIKDRKLWLEKMEAQSRMKLREIFLEEVQAEKRDKMVECGTVMGASMIKDFTQAYPPSQEQPKAVDFGTQMGGSFRKQQQAGLQTAQGMTTPLKSISTIENPSYFKRVVNNPSLILQSGYRMITNLHTVAGQMMDAFKGMVIEQRPKKFDNPEAERQAQDLTNRIVNIKTEVVGDPKVQIPRLVVIKDKPSTSKKLLEIEFKDETVPKQEEKQEEKQEQKQEQKQEEKQEEKQEQKQEEKQEQKQEENQEQKQEENQEQKQEEIEDSMLLDGLRSQKDRSTNRNSVMNLLNSGSSHKDQLKPIEAIPQLENETNTQVPMPTATHSNLFLPQEHKKQGTNIEQGIETNTKVHVPAVTHSNRFFPLQQKKQENNFKTFLQDGTSSKSTVQMADHRHKETGFKAAKQTFEAMSEQVVKIKKSLSHLKKSNKHHHCNSNGKAKVQQRKEYLRSRSRVETVIRSFSGIKTRNMRNRSKQ